VAISKYLPVKDLQTFLEGDVLFRSLAYFRNFEDERAIGDRYEGTRSHSPTGGLVITKSNGEKLRMPHAFDSSVNPNDIFVFCVSLETSSPENVRSTRDRDSRSRPRRRLTAFVPGSC